MGSYNDKEIQNVVDLILKDYEDERTINAIDVHHQPDKDVIISVVDNLLKILYPGYLSDKVFQVYTLKNTMSATIEDVIFHLKKQVAIVLKYTDEFAAAPQSVLDEKAKELTLAFMKKIPEIRASLETDVDAGFEGDPAAKSKAEIIFSYPGLFAVSVYRIAHDDRVCAQHYRYRYPSGCDDRQAFLHRSRYRYRYRRDDDHRRACQDLPGRDIGRPFDKRRPEIKRCQASSDDRKQCYDLFRCDDFRRRDSDRRRCHGRR